MKLTALGWFAGFQLITFFAFSQQTNTISGKIVDKSNKEALPFATVIIKDTNQGTVTNADGFFTLFEVPEDKTTLLVQYIGYETVEVPVKLEESSSQMLIELTFSNKVLNEVVIMDSNLENQMVDAAENISQVGFSPEALNAIPSMGEKDIFRALQLLPGVSGTNEASSGLYVRGGTPDQNLILLDGFTVYHVDHFYGFFSAFNPNAIKDVQLYKGGFESKYGGRLSSVMLLTGKTGNQNKFSGGVGIGAISANAYLEIPIGKKFNLFMAGRRSYSEIIKSSVYNSIFDLYNDQSNTTVATSNVPNQQNRRGRNRHEENTEPVFFFYDVNAKASFRPSDKDVIALSFYNGKDNLDNSRVTSNTFETRNEENITINSDINDILEWGNYGSSLRWARNWNRNYYSNLVVGYSNYFSDRDRLSNINIEQPDTVVDRTFGSVESNQLFDYTISFNNEYRPDSCNTVEFGLQTTHNQIDYTYTFNDTINIIDESNSGNIFSLFLQDAWQATPRFLVKAGIRSSYYDVTEETYFEPRLSLMYQLTDKIKLKGAWGYYYQFVNRIVREDVTEGSRDFWLLADNENSPVSFARHYIAGISYENKNWLFDVELFDKEMEGISEFSLRFQGVGAQDEESQYFFEGTGVARGLEVLMQRKVGRFKGWLSYTLSEVVHNIPGISDFPYYALHDSRHEFNLVTTYEWRKWQFGATWVYGTGKPYTAPYGEYEITTLDGTTYEYISVGAKNAFRLPDYHRLDLSVNYNFKLGKAKGSLGMSIFNVYDRQNIWYKEFLIEEEEVIETNVNLIGFTPNFNISFKF